MAITMQSMVVDFIETIPVQLPNKAFIFGMPKVIGKYFFQFFLTRNLYLSLSLIETNNLRIGLILSYISSTLRILNNF